MLTYVTAALKRVNHTHLRKTQQQPYPHIKPIYGDTSPPLTSDDKKFIQEVTGTFLYYARAVDPTMLTALSTIATQQSSPTEQTMQKVKQFLDDASTHPNAIITYHARDMVLAGHSDASCLSKSKARSRSGGHFFMSNNT